MSKPDLSDSDDEDDIIEDDSDIILQGWAEVKDPKKKSSKWKLNWLILVKGSLYLYKHFEKKEPYDSIKTLKGCEITKETDASKPFSVCVKEASQTVWIATTSVEDQTGWFEALKNSSTYVGSPAPERKAIPKAQRTTGTLFKAKKMLAGSTMGTNIIVKMFGEETHHLLMSVKKVTAKHYGKEKAQLVHRALVKVIVKIAFQIQKKNITLDKFMEIEPPLRKAFDMMSKAHNAKLRRYQKNNTDPEVMFAQVEANIKEGETLLTRLVTPYFTPKSLAQLHLVFETLCNAKFQKSIWNDPELVEELDDIDDQLSAYTQIHF